MPQVSGPLVWAKVAHVEVTPKVVQTNLDRQSHRRRLDETKKHLHFKAPGMSPPSVKRCALRITASKLGTWKNIYKEERTYMIYIYIQNQYQMCCIWKAYIWMVRLAITDQACIGIQGPPCCGKGLNVLFTSCGHEMNPSNMPWAL